MAKRASSRSPTCSVPRRSSADLCELSARRLQLDVVTLRVRDDTDFVDRADVAGRQVQRHVALELGHPDAPRLDVDVLPTLRLDVGVRDVLRAQLALAGDVAFRHDSARNLAEPQRDVKAFRG